ncbi:MAG: hypothetical protein VKI63_02515 [Cyanobium sp.]|nr:hypothetical protein [Cyanobium sp.]
MNYTRPLGASFLNQEEATGVLGGASGTRFAGEMMANGFQMAQGIANQKLANKGAKDLAKRFGGKIDLPPAASPIAGAAPAIGDALSKGIAAFLNRGSSSSGGMFSGGDAFSIGLNQPSAWAGNGFSAPSYWGGAQKLDTESIFQNAFGSAIARQRG